MRLQPASERADIPCVQGDAPQRREVSPVIPRMVISYVRRAAGERALNDLLARLPGSPSYDVLTSPSRWWTHRDVQALVDAAAETCGELDLGRRAGVELFRDGVRKGVGDAMRATGSLPATYRMLVSYGSKMSTGRLLEVAEAGDSFVLIEGRYVNLAIADPFYCGFTTGYYAEVPSVFGMFGDVVETECQFRGDERCLYRVTWRPDPSRPAVDEAGVQASATHSEVLVRSIESLRRMASDLVRARDVDEALAQITQQAGTAVQAPRYLLAVQLETDDDIRVHQCGFRQDLAASVAERLLRGEFDAHDGVLVAAVESPRRRYGYLAAFFPQGTAFSDSESRLFAAYADHATASLELVASLERARRDRDTAQALLELARSLAAVGTIDEMAARLVDVVPTVTGCQVAGVWLWEPAAEELRLNAYVDAQTNAAYDGPRVLPAAQLPRFAELVSRPRPQVIHADGDSDLLRSSMRGSRLDWAALVPIVARGEFLGVTVAGFRGHERTDDTLLPRLTGLADHAATALDGARLVERMRYQAMHDPLTGLPNRPLLEDRARAALALSRRTGQCVALLFVDLDRFKNVNDTLGHSAGDELILAAAQRLADVLRESDTLARLGGDEFVVLLPDATSPEHAVAVAQRLLAALTDPIRVSGDRELFVSCSIGIACAPEHTSDYLTLTQYADAAMYDAKARGGGTYAVYAESLTKLPARALQPARELRRALDHGELRVHYQPQVELGACRVVAVEALLRWEHPERGLLAPAAFLTSAEESGLIVPIDAWVRRTAFQQAREWLDAGYAVRVGVNLSTFDLHDPALPGRLSGELAEAGLPPDLVELEITDRVAMSEQLSPAVLARLAEVGGRVAIDNFGTGNAGLGRLRRCPVQTLKIDRTFVQDISAATGDVPIVRALVALAHGLDLAVVAEGVETEEQEQVLRALGCDLGQGFRYAAPADAEKVTAYLAAAAATVAVPAQRA